MPVGPDSTGGLRWHWRAFWHRRRWRGASDRLANWLDSTRPASSQLLLIGGSAGWMMPTRWLQRFSRIDVVDVDAHAPRLFRWNHGAALRASGTELRFMQADGIAGLDALLSQHPSATVFFDNVLGQHLYRVRDMARAESELSQIAAGLAGRDWGSVHDLFSGPVDPRLALPAPVLQFNAQRDAQGLTVDGLRDTPLHRHLLGQLGGHGEWMDHLTSNVFPVGARSRLIAWPFLPAYAHWLQAGWVTRDAGATDAAHAPSARDAVDSHMPTDSDPTFGPNPLGLSLTRR